MKKSQTKPDQYALNRQAREFPKLAKQVEKCANDACRRLLLGKSS
jgi:hypothetical protein